MNMNSVYKLPLRRFLLARSTHSNQTSNPLTFRGFSRVAKKQRDLFRCPRTFAAIDDIDQSLTDISTDEEFSYTPYIEHCQSTYTIPGLVEFHSGRGDLPYVTLTHPNGSKVSVCLHGATITSWIKTDGSESLYLRPSTPFNGKEPIAGGISLAWPQLGPGSLPLHGVLRQLHWSVVESSACTEEDADDASPSISFHTDSDDCQGLGGEWNHKFEAMYTVRLEEVEHDRTYDPRKEAENEMAMLREEFEHLGDPDYVREKLSNKTGRNRSGIDSKASRTDQMSSSGALDNVTDVGGGSTSVASSLSSTRPSVLRLTLNVINNDDKDLVFTAGILPHFLTEDIRFHKKFVKVLGLNGKYTLDYALDPMKPRLAIEQDDFLFFDPEKPANIDTLYVDCNPEGQVLFCPGTRKHFDIRNKEGFKDIEIMHPAAAAPDVAKECVVIAPARKARPVKLAPGEIWKGEVTLTAVNEYWPLPPFEKENPSTVPVPPREEALPPGKRRDGDGSAMDILYEDGDM